MKQKRKNNKENQLNQELVFGKVNKIDKRLAKMTKKKKERRLELLKQE